MQIPGKLDLYNVAVFLHVTAAMVAFGIVLLWPIALRATSARPAEHAQGLYALGAQAHQRVVTPAMVVVLIAGIYLTSARWKFSLTWINASMTLLIVLFGLVGAITVPGLRRLAHTDGQATLPPRVRLAGVISALVVVVVLALMVFKPGS